MLYGTPQAVVRSPGDRSFPARRERAARPLRRVERPANRSFLLLSGLRWRDWRLPTPFLHLSCPVVPVPIPSVAPGVIRCPGRASSNRIPARPGRMRRVLPHISRSPRICVLSHISRSSGVRVLRFLQVFPEVPKPLFLSSPFQGVATPVFFETQILSGTAQIRRRAYRTVYKSQRFPRFLCGSIDTFWLWPRLECSSQST